MTLPKKARGAPAQGVASTGRDVVDDGVGRRASIDHRVGDRAGATPADTVFVDRYLPALLAQASDLISGEFHRIVTAKGFTVSEWRVLASLAGGRALSIGELANTTTMKQPTVTRILDRMEAKGDVRRTADRADRRVTRVRITAKGARSAARLIPLATEHADRVLAPFGAKHAAELTAMLRQMIDLHRGAAAGDDPGGDRRVEARGARARPAGVRKTRRAAT